MNLEDTLATIEAENRRKSKWTAPRLKKSKRRKVQKASQNLNRRREK